MQVPKCASITVWGVRDPVSPDSTSCMHLSAHTDLHDTNIRTPGGHLPTPFSSTPTSTPSRRTTRSCRILREHFRLDSPLVEVVSSCIYIRALGTQNHVSFLDEPSTGRTKYKGSAQIPARERPKYKQVKHDTQKALSIRVMNLPLSSNPHASLYRAQAQHPGCPR